MLVGRELEQGAIERALELARSGESAALALIGEPGIGKSALLEHAAEQAGGMRLLRARGVESEAQIPFASLLELLRPALGMLEGIPEPQALALEGALALRPARARDRFAVGAATLSLFAVYAEQGPVVVLIDDAHWLDQASAEALLFAIRRLVADPIAVLLAVRDGEPSLLDGADLPTVRIGGLSRDETASLLPTLAPETAAQLHEATAGNPLGLLELARDADEFALAPGGGPLLVSARISRAFLRRTGDLDERERQALLLAATSDSGDLAVLERAAKRLNIELSALAAVERTGLITVQAGSVEFRHPLARSAIYADALPEARRAAHRALASALPDRDGDRRAWHLAAAAVGVDEQASAALEQAGKRARDRSAYSSAAFAFERAGRLTGDRERRGRLVFAAAQESWHAGFARRAVTLLDEARASTGNDASSLDIDELAGHIATRQGPVMRGHAILTSAAEHADPERAVAMLAEATAACFYAGDPAEMLAVAERAWELGADCASVRARFLASIAIGMARVAGGDAAAGSETIQEAVAVANRSPELLADLRLLPWLATAPIFLREASTGRALLDHALEGARMRSAIGALPLVLSLIALDHATTDRWAVAEATYLEAIGLAREMGQRTDLVFGLSGLARLQARRGRDAECRANVAEVLELCGRVGTRLHEVWAIEALGMLALGLGETERAVEHLEHQRRLVDELGITDPDLSPVPELIDAATRRGHHDEARRLADEFSAAADAKGQPWSLARALRVRGLVAEDASFASLFEEALAQHASTPDAFETARTQLAYGERLRRARNRKLAREQLRGALATFELLDARPWTDRARAELAATGERLRRRDPSTIDELTPQELQIALLLAGGKTTREAAAAMFLSPKTIEYHLRHVYLKLDIHSREELAVALSAQGPAHAGARDVPGVRGPGPISSGIGSGRAQAIEQASDFGLGP
jgi:DNA-binding CsgD family transcriptional regulator